MSALGHSVPERCARPFAQAADALKQANPCPPRTSHSQTLLGHVCLNTYMAWLHALLWSPQVQATDMQQAMLQHQQQPGFSGNALAQVCEFVCSCVLYVRACVCVRKWVRTSVMNVALVSSKGTSMHTHTHIHTHTQKKNTCTHTCTHTRHKHTHRNTHARTHTHTHYAPCARRTCTCAAWRGLSRAARPPCATPCSSIAWHPA